MKDVSLGDSHRPRVRKGDLTRKDRPLPQRCMAETSAALSACFDS
ncbi:hypothetical protein SAMN03159371_04968 [Variovorax sp. NFACC28]|nr:hypothetical protein SAMN03159371_04968 [Variovorax sp. NFACC28]SEG87929.1 hypothetical protein SAMN03159365_04969 [Variovorax sp. NFACC29]SFD26932.1 hypothetical protein SAMN03159379_04695 [Variovorax sp. NFACC26]SFG34918.1 hypothetical protein SAMN03159447_02968 [Variovorax sp. NFACC27]